MKDNFSTQAGAYAKYRPSYPSSLFEFILSYVNEKESAWDCGTGNGQAAAELCKHFTRVYATDISSKQVENGFKAENILYAVEPAEKTSLPDNSIDLVTVSQALHWFNFDEFYTETKRVSRQNGIIAAWTYNLPQIDPVTDKLIHHYHFQTLENYWDPERKHVIDDYKNIPFPFRQVSSPVFFIESNWNLADLRGYLETWSALQKFISKNNYNPVKEIITEIGQNWEATEIRTARFPVVLKIGYVH